MKNNDSAAAQAHTPKDLLNRLNALVLEAEKMMGAAISDQTEETIASLGSRFDAAQERIVDLYSGARKKMVSGAKYTDESIRANPYQSMALAAGVGLICGMLLSRRSK